jgi:hypothetical protein
MDQAKKKETQPGYNSKAVILFILIVRYFGFLS